jgi:hypothetical protein
VKKLKCSQNRVVPKEEQVIASAHRKAQEEARREHANPTLDVADTVVRREDVPEPPRYVEPGPSALPPIPSDHQCPMIRIPPWLRLSPKGAGKATSKCPGKRHRMQQPSEPVEDVAGMSSKLFWDICVLSYCFYSSKLSVGGNIGKLCRGDGGHAEDNDLGHGSMHSGGRGKGPQSTFVVHVTSPVI